MGEIDHAGTSKTMPAIEDATTKPGAVQGATARPAPVITSEQADEIAGEIVAEIPAEPTVKTVKPAGADKIAAERGMPPLPKPRRRATTRTRRATPASRRATKLGVSPFRKR